MPNKEHSNFAPSGMTRREACPGSYYLEVEKGVDTKSDAAREGTVCHAIIDQYFQRGIPVDQWVSFEGVTVTEDMREAVKKCIRLIEEFTYSEKYHEIKVALNDDVWGTADFIGLGMHKDNAQDGARDEHNEIYVIDYKFGRGVKVHAENNLQLQIYAVGAVNFLRALGHENLGDRRVHMVILQPRIEGEGGEEHIMTVEELILNTVPRVTDAVSRCKSEEGRNTFVNGKHCQFCSAKAFCPIFTEKAFELAKSEFSTDISVESLLEIHAAAPDILSYLRAVEATLVAACEAGKLDGPYKVEQRYGHATWADEDYALKTLVKHAKGLPLYAPSPLLSPAAITKLFKKNKIDFDITTLTERKPTSKALVKMEEFDETQDVE